MSKNYRKNSKIKMVEKRLKTYQTFCLQTKPKDSLGAVGYKCSPISILDLVLIISVQNHISRYAIILRLRHTPAQQSTITSQQKLDFQKKYQTRQKLGNVGKLRTLGRFIKKSEMVKVKFSKRR